MAKTSTADPVETAIKKWRKKKGSLIMALHDIQDREGYVPREAALKIASAMGVPLARIYEVLTFYNYFRLESPGKVVISVCTGTACFLKGAPEIISTLEEELHISEGETTDDGLFHLQTVRCVGCCGLAPVVVINGKTYGKVQTPELPRIVGEWRKQFEQEEA
jgi:NADH-quinone oxidoreductase subunit E